MLTVATVTAINGNEILETDKRILTDTLENKFTIKSTVAPQHGHVGFVVSANDDENPSEEELLDPILSIFDHKCGGIPHFVSHRSHETFRVGEI